MRPVRLRWPSASLILAAAAAFAACGGSESTAPTTGCTVSPPTGTMTASVNGTAFTASLLASATAQNSTVNGPNLVQVNGAECPAAGATGRQIVITVGRLTPITAGTYRLDAASQGLPALSGYSGIGQYTQAPNIWYANLVDAAGPGSGSITFTTVSATRLIGTFELVAVPATSNAATAKGRMTITSGSFNIPIP